MFKYDKPIRSKPLVGKNIWTKPYIVVNIVCITGKFVEYKLVKYGATIKPVRPKSAWKILDNNAANDVKNGLNELIFLNIVLVIVGTNGFKYAAIINTYVPINSIIGKANFFKPSPQPVRKSVNFIPFTNAIRTANTKIVIEALNKLIWNLRLTSMNAMWLLNHCGTS